MDQDVTSSDVSLSMVNSICTPKMVHPGAMVWVEIISIFDPNIISTQAPYVVRLLSDEEY